MKSSIARIDRQMLAIKISMGIYTVLSVGLIFFPRSGAFQINFCVQMLISATMLIYSVVSIRKTIKEIEHVFPNECFMIWHIFNFTITTIMIVFDRVTDIISTRDTNPDDIDSYRFEYFSLLISDI